MELIDKIPKYAKYLKEIMSRYKKMKKGEKINIDASCSAIVAKKISPKLKEPGSLTISIEIRDIYFSKALCDLGVNINLMPLSIYRKLELGELKNTSITL